MRSHATRPRAATVTPPPFGADAAAGRDRVRRSEPAPRARGRTAVDDRQPAPCGGAEAPDMAAPARRRLVAFARALVGSEAVVVDRGACCWSWYSTFPSVLPGPVAAAATVAMPANASRSPQARIERRNALPPQVDSKSVAERAGKNALEASTARRGLCDRWHEGSDRRYVRASVKATLVELLTK